ncbi:MAG: helix-turn-helix transcriptional regulator [Thermoactinomyces sp.]|jgi:transcriptional regulator with XRE-family HTH domain
MTFGQRLRFLREQRGLTQVDLAKKTGIKNHTLSNYERDERFPTPDSLAKLADFFGVTTDYLLYGKTEGPKPTLDDFLANNEEIIFQGVKLDERDIQKIIYELQFLVSMKKAPKQQEA